MIRYEYVRPTHSHPFDRSHFAYRRHRRIFGDSYHRTVVGQKNACTASKRDLKCGRHRASFAGSITVI